MVNVVNGVQSYLFFIKFPIFKWKFYTMVVNFVFL